MPSVDLNACETDLREKFLRGRRAYEGENFGRLLRVTATHRSAKEQWVAWMQGRMCIDPSRPDDPDSWVEDTDPKTFIVTKVDGRTKLSKHNYFPSRAIDFAVTIAGKIVWVEAEYYKVGPFMEAEGLVWGGSWKSFKDLPHVELP